MYTPQEIVAKIQQGLKTCYEKHDGQKLLMNAKISLVKGKIEVLDSVKCEWMERNKKLNSIKIGELFGVNPMIAMKVSSYLKDTLKSFAAQDKIPEAQISAKLYSHKADYYPSVNLFDGENLVREITIEELIKT